jgi:hypothetical protein
VSAGYIRRFTTRRPRSNAVCPRRNDLGLMNTDILANAGHDTAARATRWIHRSWHRRPHRAWGHPVVQPWTYASSSGGSRERRPCLHIRGEPATSATSGLAKTRAPKINSSPGPRPGYHRRCSPAIEVFSKGDFKSYGRAERLDQRDSS